MDEMNLNVDKALIKKYFEGTCNKDELIRVNAFLKQHNAQLLFDELWDEEWALKKNLAAPQVNTPEEIEGWKKTIHQKINEEAQRETTIPAVPFFKKIKTWQYAALWTAMIIGAGLWFVQSGQRFKAPALVYAEAYNSKGHRTTITLSDGSKVYLGAESKLRYTKQFSTNIREVNLEGEAFFEVTKNPDKPFVIHTGNVTTKVLGTSFKIDAFLNKPVTVFVSTGKVRVDHHLANQTESIAVLTPGQTVTWNEAMHTKTLGSALVTDITGWKEGHLVFNKTPLSEIAATLERWYDVKISFKDKKKAGRLMKINLTANIPINTLIRILAVSGQFKYQIEGHQITII